ncbi:prostasin-like [Haliotis rufescens]|uniref:prostasin-like n=1 Tax=Haliotis rufescens TaxID=6454 RepID=UPI001EAFC717|nr:prostasin-like [Haliotis rufescens]
MLTLLTTVGYFLVTYAQVQEPCGYDALPRPTYLQGRILNAPIAGVCDWPWMVAVRENAFPNLRLCSGVLIGRDKVITTASCVMRLNNPAASPLQVIVGEHDITADYENLYGRNNDTIVLVRSVVTHPQFSGKANDIAVIRLREPVTYGDCALPACLPTSRAPGDCGHQVVDKCAYAGWGLYTDRSFLRSAKMRAAWGRYYDQELCSTIYRLGRNNLNPANTVCIDPKIQDQRPCQGDEGGMVACAERGRWILESLINEPSCQDTYPTLGVDLRASTIINFINSN